MYLLCTALFAVNAWALVSLTSRMVESCRKSSVHPQVDEYCMAQYYAIMGYYQSRIINEFNEKFLPENEKIDKTEQYKDVLKKIRENKMSPRDFVDIQEETYESQIDKPKSE